MDAIATYAAGANMSLYQCPFCGEQVTTVADLKWHVRHWHKSHIQGKNYLECKFYLNMTGVSEK